MFCNVIRCARIKKKKNRKVLLYLIQNLHQRKPQYLERLENSKEKRGMGSKNIYKKRQFHNFKYNLEQVYKKRSFLKNSIATTN